MSFDPKSVVQKARETIARYSMLEPGDKVLVGVSGGADSLALLFVLIEIAPAIDIELAVFHLDHMMRTASREDAEFVRGAARSMKIPAIVESFDVPAFIKKNKLSPEDGARQVRYEMMREAAKRTGTNKIAVGHTADDQVETFIMRMIRGSGLGGLKGIPAVNGEIIRPLIRVWRRETAAYCESLNIEPRTDETNRDPSHLRNRVRHTLIPLIEKDLNSGFKEEALREADVIDTDLELVEGLAEAAASEIAKLDARKAEIELDAFLDLHPALGRRVLRSAIRRLKGDLLDVTFRNVDDVIEKVARGKSGSSLELPGGLTAYRRYDMICIEFSSDFHKVEKDIEQATLLKVPGTTQGEGPGFFVRSDLLDREAVDITPDQDTAHIDADLIEKADRLIIRPVRKGDRFRPLGMAGTKKVQDFFTDAKVPRKDRERALVVEDKGKIVWLVGHRLDDGYKVTRSTRKVLVLKAGKEKSIGRRDR